MRVFAFLLVLCAVAAFRPVRFGAPIQRQGVLTRLADSPKYDIVPVEKETVESAASVTGAVVGFLVAGPVGSLLVAAFSNWLVKKDNDGGEALRGVGKAVVDGYNYVRKINSKLDVTGKVSSAIENVVEKASSESESAATAKATITDITSKAQSVIAEYDLATKASALAKASVELSSQAIDKLDELNTKYDFVKTATTTAEGAIAKAKEAAKSV